MMIFNSYVKLPEGTQIDYDRSLENHRYCRGNDPQMAQQLS